MLLVLMQRITGVCHGWMTRHVTGVCHGWMTTISPLPLLLLLLLLGAELTLGSTRLALGELVLVPAPILQLLLREGV